MSAASGDYDERLTGEVDKRCGLLHRHRPRAGLGVRPRIQIRAVATIPRTALGKARLIVKE
jgi:hypothetical protein